MAKLVDLLLVEDNQTDMELTLRALKKNNLTENVAVARDGEEALKMIFSDEKSKDYDPVHPKVILLDLKLPKVNGLEVLEKIKSDPRTKVIPVVVVTSSQESKDLSQSYVLGANSYIVKPVDYESFVRALSEAGLYWLLINKPVGE